MATDTTTMPAGVRKTALFLFLLGLVSGTSSGVSVWLADTQFTALIGPLGTGVIVGGLSMGLLFIAWIGWNEVALVRKNAKKRAELEANSRAQNMAGWGAPAPVDTGSPYVAVQHQEPPSQIGP